MHLHYTNTLPATFRCQRPFTNPPASCQQAAGASQQPASIKYWLYCAGVLAETKGRAAHAMERRPPGRL